MNYHLKSAATMFSKICTFSLTLILLLLSSSPVATQEIPTLKLGVIPFKSPRAVVELYSPVAALLADVLGIRVQVVTARSYEQYLERIYEKQYDMIVLGSTFYFKAHERAGYLAVARGYPPFHAGIIVLQNSSITSLEQLRGKTMAAVNSSDRAGYKLQKTALRKQHIDLEKELTVHFRGDFDSIIYAVLSGQDDAGAIRLDALNRHAFAKVKEKLRIIYTSPANPQFPVAVNPDMDAALRHKIRNALVSIEQSGAGADILEKLHIQGFEAIDSNDMEHLRKSRQKEKL